MRTRTAALVLALLITACAPTGSQPDAGAARRDAQDDGIEPRVLERDAAGTPYQRVEQTVTTNPDLASPRLAASASLAASPRLAAIATAISGRTPRAFASTDVAAEPPAALLRAAARGRRARGVVPRIARSADGLEVWVVVGRGPSRWTSHLRLAAPSPAGTRVLPVYDLPYEDTGFALVDDAAHTALLLPTWPEATPFAIEAAPSPSRDGASALDATTELRWMKSCPTSRSECLLFGAPAAVAHAVDPIEPPYGWSLQTTLHSTSPRRALPPDAVTIGDGVQLAVVAQESDDDDDDDDHDDGSTNARCGVWADVGTATLEVLEVPCYDEQGFEGGIFTAGTRRIVWAWETSAARVHFAELDGGGGVGAPRSAAPRTAAAESYYDIDCVDAWASTRPLPVLDGAHLGVALVWGAREALYFAEGSTHGQLLRALLPADPFATDDGVSELPPVLRIARCGDRRCVRPAR